jgi:hypothetical protein
MVNVTADENLEASLSSLNVDDVSPGRGGDSKPAGVQERLWHSMSVVDCARPQEMLPLRPGSSRFHLSSAPSSSDTYSKQRGHQGGALMGTCICTPFLILSPGM